VNGRYVMVVVIEPVIQSCLDDSTLSLCGTVTSRVSSAQTKQERLTVPIILNTSDGFTVKPAVFIDEYESVTGPPGLAGPSIRLGAPVMGLSECRGHERGRELC